MIKNRFPLAVVTYKREIIKTLDNLPSFSNVIIFVENEECKRIIKQCYTKKYKTVITNTMGIVDKRNFVIEYFKNKPFVFCDDDIDGLYEKNTEGKLEKLNEAQVNEVINRGFGLCKKYSTRLWGVYPVVNAFYMGPDVSLCGFVIGTFCGVVPSEIRMDETLELKEDYEFTAKHVVKHGRVIRFNRYAIKAEHYTNQGGCVSYRTQKNENIAFKFLLKKYPYLFRSNPKRKNEIIMKNIIGLVPDETL